MGTCCSRDDSATHDTRRNEKDKLKSKLDKYSITHDIKEKYEFVTNLGTGTFGKVKLYRDKKCKDIKFAIKTVKKEGNKNIVDEIMILRTIDHPNIVKYFEVYEDDFNINIVMEYIPGETFDKVISKLGKGGFSELDAYNVLSCLLKAVLFLHNMNIIHKDLKLENILFSVLGRYDSLKIIDFGLSSKETKPNDNKDQFRVGTTHYMAPEVILFDTITPKVDIWAIGVLIYKIFTGTFPFDGKKEDEVFSKAKKGQYDEAKLDKLKLSKELKDLIKKFLTVKVDERISVTDALNHEWFTKFREGADIMIDKGIIENLSKFEKANCFQKEILFYLAKIATDYEIANYKQIFSNIDSNNNGVIEIEEIFDALKKHKTLTDVINIFIYTNMLFAIFIYLIIIIIIGRNKKAMGRT